jgi:hypothetical protein
MTVQVFRQDKQTGRWQWRCTQSCATRVDGPFYATKFEAMQAWKDRYHPPSNYQMLRAMGYDTRRRRR